MLNTLSRISRSAPAQLMTDAIGLAAICLMVLAALSIPTIV